MAWPAIVDRRASRITACRLHSDDLQGRQDSNLRPTVLETAALPTELRPWVAEANGTGAPEWQHHGMQRRLLGILFAALAAGLALVAVFSALEGGGAWVIALASAALAFWLADLARRALMRTRA